MLIRGVRLPSIAKIFGAGSVRPGNKIRVICRIYTPGFKKDENGVLINLSLKYLNSLSNLMHHIKENDNKVWQRQMIIFKN